MALLLTLVEVRIRERNKKMAERAYRLKRFRLHYEQQVFNDHDGLKKNVWNSEISLKKKLAQDIRRVK